MSSALLSDQFADSYTAVTMLKEAGIPAAVVMERIGHDSKQMSEHYTHVGTEALKKATEVLPDVSDAFML